MRMGGGRGLRERERAGSDGYVGSREKEGGEGKERERKSDMGIKHFSVRLFLSSTSLILFVPVTSLSHP